MPPWLLLSQWSIISNCLPSRNIQLHIRAGCFGWLPFMCFWYGMPQDWFNMADSEMRCRILLSGRFIVAQWNCPCLSCWNIHRLSQFDTRSGVYSVSRRAVVWGRHRRNSETTTAMSYRCSLLSVTMLVLQFLWYHFHSEKGRTWSGSQSDWIVSLGDQLWKRFSHTMGNKNSWSRF